MWFFCFSDEGEVEVQAADGTVRATTVAAVQPGEAVKTQAGGFQRVVYVHEGGPSSAVVEVQFEGEGGRRGRLGLTPQHLIFTEGDNVKKAGELQVGDPIQVWGGQGVVIALRPVTEAVRSLITANGELLVNGVRVSSYAFDGRLHHLTQSVAWLGRVDPKLPDKVCRAATPAVVKYAFPLWFEEVHEARKAAQAEEGKSTGRNTLRHPLSALKKLHMVTAA